MKFLLFSLAIVFLASALVGVLLLSTNNPLNSVVGHATAANGSVTIIIDSRLEITLTNTTINFGTCELNLSDGFAVLDSSQNEFYGSNIDCFGGEFPSSLVVRNIGNTLADVSVSFNESGPTFFNDSDSWLAYKTINTTLTGGCLGNSQVNFTNVSVANSPLLACDNLSPNFSQNEFSLFLKAHINSSATGGGELKVTFSAQPTS